MEHQALVGNAAAYYLGMKGTPRGVKGTHRGMKGTSFADASQVDVLATLQRGSWINVVGMGATIIGLQVHQKKDRLSEPSGCEHTPFTFL